MDENIIVYSKQVDEPRVPVTARIKWMPDGTIIPLMYWTPDGSCYQVKPGCVMMPIAFLKDRGVGIRFKVMAEIIDTPDMDDDLLHSMTETYLYLADNWFCGRNFIDARYGHAGKEYVPVTLDVFPDCSYELVYFWVHGIRYMVEKTHKVEARGSFYAGGIGIWHKVDARVVNADDDEDPDPTQTIRRLAALYFEVNKWFVTVMPTGAKKGSPSEPRREPVLSR